MEIVRYQGEMLASQVMRARRMGESWISFGTRSQVDSVPINKNLSFRFPIADPRGNSLRPKPDFNDLCDGTAWLLLSLFWGFNLCVRYDECDRFFRVKDLHTEKNLKFCPLCAKAQRSQHGISWWVRDTNLPSVVMCTTHRSPLLYVARERAISTFSCPHELVDIAVPVATQYCDRADLIGQSVIALCHRSLDLDPDVVKRFARERGAVVGKVGELAALMGAASRFSHQNIANADLRQQGLPVDKNDHDGLTKSGDADLLLALVASAFDWSMKELEELISASSSYCLLPRDNLSLVVTELIPRTRYRKSRHPIDCLRKFCQLRLKGQRRPSAKLRDCCIEMLLLEQLAPDWLQAWMRKNASSASFFPFSEWRFEVGLNALRIVFDAIDRHEAEASRYPIIQKFMREDAVVREWEQSYIAVCVEQAKNFIAEISRGSSTMFPEPIDYSIVPS